MGQYPPAESVGRYGLSIRSHLGHPELVAVDQADYVARAAALAADRNKLAALRRTLRSTLHASPLRDGPFTRGFEDALRGMWRLWCAKVG